MGKGTGIGQESEQPLLLPRRADGTAQSAQATLTLRPQIKPLEQAQQIVGQQRLGQGRQHVEPGIVQQAAGAVDQGLVVGGEQHDGQAAVLVLGLAHQQADGILIHQAEIAHQQLDLATGQRLDAGIAILHPLTGQSQSLISCWMWAPETGDPPAATPGSGPATPATPDSGH